MKLPVFGNLLLAIIYNLILKCIVVASEIFSVFMDTSLHTYANITSTFLFTVASLEYKTDAETKNSVSMFLM